VELSKQRIARQMEITVFVYATESRSKVVKAVRNLFPKDLDLPICNEVTLDGYYGDPITSLKFLVKHRRTASELFDHIVSGLSSLDYVSLLDELPRRIDDTKNLYIRLDKQKAYQGKFALGHKDPIRLKISLLLPHKCDPVQVVKEYLEDRSL